MDAFNSWRHESDERLQMLLAEQNRADNALKELRQWHPLADEIKRVDERLLQLDWTEKENAARQTAVKSQIAQITAEYEMKESEMKQTSQHEQEHLEADRTQIREQIAKIDELLARLDGSFYKWLCENKEGWENTIGKVVDEERILYAQGIEPQLDVASGSLYGVKLDLDNIASVHRTPDEYRLEKKDLEERVRQINRRLMQLPITLQEEIAKLGKKYAARLNPLRQQATLLKVEEEQIPVKRQDLQNRRHQLEMEEQERAEVFVYFSPEWQNALLPLLPRDMAVRLFESMAADERADLYHHLDEEARQKLMPALARVEREDILRLAAYAEGTTGSVTTSDYVAVTPQMRVAEALAHVRATAPDKETIYILYALDAEGRLCGTVSLRELLLADDRQTIGDIMRRHPVSVRADSPREEAAERIRRISTLALETRTDILHDLGLVERPEPRGQNPGRRV